MSGYRGDGYGVYGDHGDDDFYDEMRRGRELNQRSGRRDDASGRGRGGEWRHSGRDREQDDGGFMLDRNQEEGRRPWRDERDEHRGESFLERAGHQARDWMDDDDGDEHRVARPPMGLGDPSRRGGGLGMSQQQRFSGHGPHDHYLSWRERQMAELDRDYDEYCRENEQKFSSEFEKWRQSRRTPPGSDSPAAMPLSPTGDATASNSIEGAASSGSEDAASSAQSAPLPGSAEVANAPRSRSKR